MCSAFGTNLVWFEKNTHHASDKLVSNFASKEPWRAVSLTLLFLRSSCSREQERHTVKQ